MHCISSKRVNINFFFPPRKGKRGDLPDPGIKPGSPAWEADSLLSEPLRKSLKGDVEAFDFSSACPLLYFRPAYCLKDVALSKDIDGKVHWLEANRSLSAYEELTH